MESQPHNQHEAFIKWNPGAHLTLIPVADQGNATGDHTSSILSILTTKNLTKELNKNIRGKDL